jgi:hypothetical protein
VPHASPSSKSLTSSDSSDHKPGSWKFDALIGHREDGISENLELKRFHVYGAPRFSRDFRCKFQFVVESKHLYSTGRFQERYSLLDAIPGSGGAAEEVCCYAWGSMNAAWKL